MLGKVALVGAGAWWAAFEVNLLPDVWGLVIAGTCSVIVVQDLAYDGPARRWDARLDRWKQRSAQLRNEAEQRRALEVEARAERERNGGLDLSEHLSDADREWLVRQARMAIEAQR